MTIDVVVVGAGVMGAATAYRLAASGRRVLLLERFETGHARGSSHGRSRIFRFSYPDPAYVGMAIEAQGLWLELERDGGRVGELLMELGGLDVGGGIESNAAALTEYGVPFEMLTGTEVTKRHPGLALPADLPVLFQADGGIVAADRAVETFVSVALRSGAEIRENALVSAIEPDSDGVTVHIADAQVRAEAVVVTAGPWVTGLVAPLGINLPVKPTRETIAYFEIGGEIGPTLVEWADPAVYSLASPGHDALKVGEHIAGPLADPDTPGAPDQESISRLSAWVAERYRSANPEPISAETCFYTNTDDSRFILERHDRVIVGSACSGHGFKFAPFIGKTLAELAEEVL